MSDSSIFIVNYRDPEKPNEMIEVRVRHVDDSALGPAFIALSDFVFGTSGGKKSLVFLARITCISRPLKRRVKCSTPMAKCLRHRWIHYANPITQKSRWIYMRSIRKSTEVSGMCARSEPVASSE